MGKPETLCALTETSAQFHLTHIQLFLTLAITWPKGAVNEAIHGRGKK